jgi:hypothetical protein
VPIGGSRVGHLEFSLIPPGEYPAMTLRLSQAGIPDRQIAREAETTPAGRAVLRFVLLDAPCALAVEPALVVELSPEIQETELEIVKSRVGSKGVFVLEIGRKRAAAPEPAETPWQVFLRAGNEFWLPCRLSSEPDQPRVRFSRLEPGIYTLDGRLRGEERSLSATGKASPLAGQEHAFAAQGETAEQMPIEPLRIHLSDPPVDAVLEGSSTGGSYVTFFTEDKDTAAKKLRYQLGAETGRIVWEETATAGLWRSDHPLSLPAQQAVELAPSLVITEAAKA